MQVLTAEKKETIRKLQEAVGRSKLRLKIIKNLNKKESIHELHLRLKIHQPAISKAITRFETYGLVRWIGRKGKSNVYDKVPMLKQIGSVDKWMCVKIAEEEGTNKPRVERIRNKLHLPSLPYVDSKVESECERMVEPFKILYLFENSLRNFIVSVLTENYGVDWWEAVVTKKEILEKVQTRKESEGINKWHVPRGAHKIFYTDLEDLTYFLRKEEQLFKKYLDVELWDTTIRKVVKLSRNVIDHHNPLPYREIYRLREIMEDWKRQLKR